MTVRRRRGFTLVELLVVIGIIAVLVGILLPVVSRVKENANFVACRSNLNQMAIGLRMYSNDFRDHLPDPGVLGDDASACAPFRRGVEWPDENDPTIKETLGFPNMMYQRGYLKSREVWLCPSNERFRQYGNTYNILATRTYAAYTSKQRASRTTAFYIYENTTNLPWTTNVGRPNGSDGNLGAAQTVYPHRYKVRDRAAAGVANNRQGAINCVYVDGTVGIILYVKSGTSVKTHFIRGE